MTTSDLLALRPTDTHVETARLHHRVRVALVELLAAATPVGWEVTDTTTFECGTLCATLDIAVGPVASVGRVHAVPVLCVDVAGHGERDGPWHDRRHVLARLGVDHYWNLSTGSGTLDVYVRTDDEYRHAETVEHADWLDYGVGVVHLDLPRLLER